MKALIAASLALALCGCATTLGVLQLAGKSICERQEATRLGMIVALSSAELIADPIVRTTTIEALKVSIEALDYCPDSQ